VALALYRKYRPRTFAEIIGQEHVTEPLMQALRSGRLNHAYLFSGPRGCGKTSSARILARSLNCERGPTPQPCGECDSCVALAPDGAGSIDVIEIDAASHGGVDDARDLRERAIFAPVSSRFKVYVIDEAHMVSSAGFNALLKLVEEPPEYVKFVFATTEPEKVLGTIKSRTHHYPFRLIPPGVLRPYLEQLCLTEQVKVEPAVFPLVVRAGGGSARDSLSVLDQLIAGAGTEGVTYARAVALLGVTDVALIDEMCDALAAGDGAAAYATIDQVAEAGHDPRRFATDLLGRLRDLIVLQQVPDAAGKGLLDAPDDELARMALQAQRFGPATLSRLADIVHNGLTEMRGTTAPRLLLELICARMLLPGAEDSVGALLQRIERMERRIVGDPQILDDSTPLRGTERPRSAQPPNRAPQSERAAQSEASEAAGAEPGASRRGAEGAGGSAAPTSLAAARQGSAEAGQRASAGADGSAVPGVQPAPTSPEAARQGSAGAGGTAAPDVHLTPDTSGGSSAIDVRAPSGGPSTIDIAAPGGGGPRAIDAVAVRRVWDEILAYVGRKRRAAAAVAREATVREVDGNTLVLVFKHQVHASMLSNGPELLLEAVYEVLGAPSPDRAWQVRCEVSGQPPAGGQPGGGQPAPRPPVPPTPRSAPARSAAAAPSADTDWPTTAQPGGAAPAPRRDPEPPTASAPARAATSKARGRGANGGRPAKAQPADEPPYDPDYDPPVRDATYEGFDPGDEPLDEVIDEQTARQTSEEQALHLLQQTLGAEKIG
jgi:DNA polymerase-3 subunit gamma/tau